MASWSSTGNCHIAVTQTSAITLQDGRVLKIGGVPLGFGDTNVCELYDPVTGIWTLTGSLNQARCSSLATVLANGKVLLFGGGSMGGAYPVYTSTELYDPSTGIWTLTGSMAQGRIFGGGWHLADDRVLIAGGAAAGLDMGFSGASQATSEIYDPVAGTWSSTGPLNAVRQCFGFALSGNVPVAIGGCGTTAPALTSTETFDINTLTWTTKAACSVAGTFNDGFNNAVTLQDGKILLASGRTAYYDVAAVTGNCAVYDVGTDSWSTVGSLLLSRIEGQLWILQSGKVLMMGGAANNDTIKLTECELYDPSLQTWSVTAPAPEQKDAIYTDIGPLLSNGKAILVSGFGQFIPVLSTQLFDPTGVGPSAKQKASTFLVF